MFSGERLRKLREEKGLSQKDLAKMFNVKDPTINRYEKGHRQPDTETLIKLSDFFECSTDYILGKSDMRNYEKEKKEKNGYISVAEKAKDYGVPFETLEEFIEFWKKHQVKK